MAQEIIIKHEVYNIRLYNDCKVGSLKKVTKLVTYIAWYGNKTLKRFLKYLHGFEQYRCK